MKSKSFFNPVPGFTTQTSFFRYYYQYKEDRLPTCVLTIHGLLHIVNDIRNAGPCWATWTFWTERYCGMLQGGLHSKSNPAANLDKRVQRIAYLGQLSNKYDLNDELSTIDNWRSDDVRRGEREFPDCEQIILLVINAF